MRTNLQELAMTKSTPMADRMADTCPISPNITDQQDIPEMVTKAEVERLLEAQKTVLFEQFSVLLSTAQDAVEPLATAVPEDLKSTPHRIRTCNLRFRRPTLYPVELVVHEINQSPNQAIY